jgi:hypothetical protein
MVPQAVSDHLAAQRRQVAKALLAVRSEWSRMGDDLDASWARIGPRIVTLTAAAQLGSVRDGIDYVVNSLESQGTPVRPVADINPRGFVGLASDGRSLEALLYSSVVHARSVKVDTLPQRLSAGGAWLEQIVHTQVADAARDGAKVAMTVRPRVRWVRIVSPPCCGRCAILSGRVYAFSQGFQRHPRCDCTMLPQTVADPFAAGRKITAADVTDLTGKQRLALAASTEKDPAKALAQVVNDHARKRGAFSDYLPPTRVDAVIDRAAQRDKAMDALRQIGIVT